MDNLEQIIDSLADSSALGSDLRKLSREDALKTIQQVLKIMKDASLGVSNSGHKSVRPVSSSPSKASASSSSANNQYSNRNNTVAQSSSQGKEPVVNGSVFINRKDLQVPSPSSDISGYPSTRGSPSDSGVDIPAASKPSLTSLTSTLASCYREDMIKHVQNWPAEHSEKQVSFL